MKEKFYVTTPIYYASGKPHIGHAFATLYADVIARYWKQKGRDVFFSTGTDEHGSKIYEKARSAGKKPQEFVDEIALEYKKAWAALGIEYDGFIRTTSEPHKAAVREFIKRLWEAGDIYEGFYEGLYCPECEDFITEKKLKNGLCPEHLREPEKIKEKNYFFNLQKFLPRVREALASGELEVVPQSRRNEMLSIIDGGIPDFSITREKVKHGIPFPYDESQVVYVWADALVNYLSVLGYPEGENFKKFWPADLHIIGVEINKFHSIFWPAMLLSARLPLPRKIFVHGLFTVNGQKMSKTLGNVIDPVELVGRFGQDAARWLILSQFPAEEHGDIKESEFVQRYNGNLSHGIGNLFERVFAMAVNYGFNMERNNRDSRSAEVEKRVELYYQYMESCKLFEALAEVFALAKMADRYIAEKKPYLIFKEEGLSEELKQSLSFLLYILDKISECLAPFMPLAYKKIADYRLKIKEGKAGKGAERQKLNLFPLL